MKKTLFAFSFLIVFSFCFSSLLLAKLYVTDAGVGAVAVYNNTDDGNVPAQQTISGPNTAIQTPLGIDVDADYIYVTQYSSNSVTVYNQNADGNVTPVRTITGAATLLSEPHGLAIDNSFIYVVNMGGSPSEPYSHAVTVYNLTGNGNLAPVRTISGDQTGLGVAGQGGPGGVAVDANYVYVVRPATNAILVYDINANGNVAPVRTITGNMDVPYGIDVDENYIYVGNIGGNGSITVYNLTDTGNVSPVRIITGNLTTLSNTIGIAVDGEFIYAANGNGQNIPVFNLTDNGNIAPVRSITSVTVPEKIAVYSACVPPPANLVSWWRAEGDANDTMGTNNGTIHNGTTFGTGKVGQAFSFDGVDDAVHVGMLGSIGLNETQPFSVSTWVNSNDPAAGYQVIAGNYMGEGGDTGNFSTYLRIQSSNLYFEINKRQLADEIIATPISSGWQYVTATYDGNELKLFLNGMLKASTSRTFSGSTDNTRGWDIGNFSPETNAAHGFESTFNGLIDEVAVFDRALTEEEIQSIYNAGSAGKCDIDTTPDPFAFTDQTGVNVNTVTTSNSITVNGIYVANISISSCTGTNCEYQINTDGWTPVAGTVRDGDTVTVRQTSSASYSTLTDLVLNIGGDTGTFSVTTMAIPHTRFPWPMFLPAITNKAKH